MNPYLSGLCKFVFNFFQLPNYLCIFFLCKMNSVLLNDPMPTWNSCLCLSLQSSVPNCTRQPHEWIQGTALPDLSVRKLTGNILHAQCMLCEEEKKNDGNYKWEQDLIHFSATLHLHDIILCHSLKKLLWDASWYILFPLETYSWELNNA